MKIVIISLPVAIASGVDSAHAIRIGGDVLSINLEVIKSPGVSSGTEGNRELYCALPVEITEQEESVWSIELYAGADVVHTKIIHIESTIADSMSSEGVIYLKRILALLEGNTTIGIAGTAENPSAAILDTSGNIIQDILVENDERISYSQLMIDRTGNVPSEVKISMIDGETTDVIVTSTVSSPIMKEGV